MRPLLALLRTAVTATTHTATGFAPINLSSPALGRAACGKRGADFRPHFEPGRMGGSPRLSLRPCLYAMPSLQQAINVSTTSR